MKHRTQFPADLMALLVVPIFAITVIGVIASSAQSFFNWLVNHH